MIVFIYRKIKKPVSDGERVVPGAANTLERRSGRPSRTLYGFRPYYIERAW